MIRKQFTPSIALAASLAALPLMVAPVVAQDAASGNSAPASPTMGTAAPATSVAVAPPAVIAEPSPSANLAYQAMRGVVITRPGANAARVSLGSRNTLRVGARVEYLQNGLQIATGRVTSLNFGDAVATIEPEAADHYVGINTDVRVLENPARNLGPTQDEIEDREFRRFERNFAISAAVAAAVYYLWIQD
jgi:hypothetical protein